MKNSKKQIAVQDMQILFRNLHIYYNYDELVPKYNSNCRKYIRICKGLYHERILHSLEYVFADRSEDEIMQALKEFCNVGFGEE